VLQTPNEQQAQGHEDHHTENHKEVSHVDKPGSFGINSALKGHRLA
jgi:hypothetical protein